MKLDIFLFFFSVFLALFLRIPFSHAEITNVIITKPYSSEDVRYIYAEKLLQLALEKAEFSSKVVRAAREYPRKRLLHELVTGKNVHVGAEVPISDWEEQLIPIRIPLRKGIQGYRLFLINSPDQDALSHVKSLAELVRFPTGSGAQWSITPILSDAGFDVVTSDDYTTLFKMLNFRRFVTFSRGLNEIYSEQETFSMENKDLVIEKSLGIYIPLPTYFFVSPSYPELAQKIELGLNRMIDDGSFDKHFLEFHRADIDRAELAFRKIFSIPNPNLSAETPMDKKQYWFDPKAYSNE